MFFKSYLTGGIVAFLAPDVARAQPALDQSLTSTVAADQKSRGAVTTDTSLGSATRDFAVYTKRKVNYNSSNIAIAASLVGTVSLAISTPAHAQSTILSPTEQAAASDPATADIVVTGSRIANGFNAPTPVTVTSAEELRETSPRNLGDALQQLPIFSSSLGGPRSTGTSVGQNPGQYLLNLRGLGANRNLILLDGRRLPASNTGGSVDINVIPQNLVSRVDVVTGGASAAYGSDAVTGVVNFILDTRFEGLKAEVQSGISTYGDLWSRGGSLAFGTSFADDRARLIASVEYQQEDGIDANKLTGRKWFDFAAGRVPNPDPNGPTFLVIPDIRSSIGAYGGLITGGPLKGTQFLEGGEPAPFHYGPNLSGAFMTGGDGPRKNNALAPYQKRGTAFVHAEYDLTDNLQIFLEGQYAELRSKAGNAVNVHLAAGNQYTIFQDNAFLPEEIRQRMIEEDIESFPLGRYDRDFPLRTHISNNKMLRAATGIEGSLGRSWVWDASYTFGQTKQEIGDTRITNNRRIYAATDAVVDPATGAIVCRSTLAGYDPGCLPLNLFGEGSPDPAAVDWVIGDSLKWLTLRQNVAQFNVSGDLGDSFQFGAGPIAVAAGLEYRSESANQVVDPISATVTDFTGVRGFPVSQQGRPGGYQFFNPLPLSGDYDVKEGYIELGLPILADVPFAYSLDATVAARVADYSTSGTVVTWKAGFNYEIIPDIRLRLTRSRDIRGPNILELFNSASQGSSNTVWKGVTTPYLTISSGNPDLNPEKADTLTYGVVYRPSWFPGLQASVDYYDISIAGAIGGIPNIIERCDQQNYQPACDLITVTPANTLIVRSQVVNLTLVENKGIDFEVAYNHALFNGDLSMRLLANHAILDETTAPGSDEPVTGLGTASNPRWAGTLRIGYSQDYWNLFVLERYIHKTLMNVLEVEGVDTTDNTVPAIWYTTAGASYNLNLGGHKQEIFATINNLFDKDPPISVINPTNYSIPTHAAFDRVGRYFNLGVRVEW